MTISLHDVTPRELEEIEKLIEEFEVHRKEMEIYLRIELLTKDEEKEKEDIEEAIGTVIEELFEITRKLTDVPKCIEKVIEWGENYYSYLWFV